MDNLSITEAQAKIRIQNEKLAEAHYDLSKWKVEFTFDVNPTTFEMKITAMKPFGGGGAIRTVTKDEIQYYDGDYDTLIRGICEQFYESLLKDQLFNSLAPNARLALSNTATMIKLSDGKK